MILGVLNMASFVQSLPSKPEKNNRNIYTLIHLYIYTL